MMISFDRSLARCTKILCSEVNISYKNKWYKLKVLIYIEKMEIWIVVRA